MQLYTDERAAEYLPKNWLSYFQGSVVTYLRCGGNCRICFVANFIRLPAVQKVWKSVKMWQSYREFKSRNFFETQCSHVIMRSSPGCESCFTAQLRQAKWRKLNWLSRIVLTGGMFVLFHVKLVSPSIFFVFIIDVFSFSLRLILCVSLLSWAQPLGVGGPPPQIWTDPRVLT